MLLTKRIDAAGTLGSKELATVMAKLRNPDGVSAVPICLQGDRLRIGCDDSDFDNELDFIGRKLGYRVHSV